MSLNKQVAKRTAASKEIKDFTRVLYDYIWSKQEFCIKEVSTKFIEEYSQRLSQSDDTKIKSFTEDIGKAVWVSQFLLREYFRKFFQFTFSKSCFKNDVKLFCSHWLQNRSNVFVKVIDTLAIIAEAILFCQKYRKFRFELNEANEWFIEWFEESLSASFFRDGGWKQLDKLSNEWYSPLYKHMDNRMKMFRHSTYLKIVYDCNLIDFLRTSEIMFPIPQDVFCSGCKALGDENLYRRIVYLRPEREVEAQFPESALIRLSAGFPVEKQPAPAVTNDMLKISQSEASSFKQESSENLRPSPETRKNSLSKVVSKEHDIDGFQSVKTKECTSSLQKTNFESFPSKKLPTSKSNAGKSRKKDQKENLQENEDSSKHMKDVLQYFASKPDSVAETSDSTEKLSMADELKDFTTVVSPLLETSLDLKQICDSSPVTVSKTELSVKETCKMGDLNENLDSDDTLTKSFTRYKQAVSVDGCTNLLEKYTLCDELVKELSTNCDDSVPKKIPTEPSVDVLEDIFTERLSSRKQATQKIAFYYFTLGVQQITKKSPADIREDQTKYYLISEEYSDSLEELFEDCYGGEQCKTLSISACESGSIPVTLRAGKSGDESDLLDDNSAGLMLLLTEFPCYFIGKLDT